MENASKALLIAASVLIVILLIAFGMKIFNSTKGTGDQVEGTMQTTEMAMFNNKFIPYLGNNRSKSDALALLNIIQANNATNSRRITVYIYGYSNTIDNAQGGIQNISNDRSSPTFEIVGSYSEGYINLIEITK